mmetsp:Transcript_43700/g.113920  ORF Transcript_43700/g.113920 Transcript_43700/m.113920 type:complete len:741 (-) Transcript_43700:178-2400(-)
MWTKRIGSGSDPAMQILLLDVHHMVKRLTMMREEDPMSAADPSSLSSLRRRSVTRGVGSSGVNAIDMARIALAEFCVFRRRPPQHQSIAGLSSPGPTSAGTPPESPRFDTKARMWSELAMYADEMGIPVPARASTFGVIGDKSAMTFAFPRQKAKERTNDCTTYHGGCFSVSPRVSAINLVAALSLAQCLSPLLISRASRELEAHFQSIGEKGISSLLGSSLQPPSILQLAQLYAKEASDCYVIGDAARSIVSITAQQMQTDRIVAITQRWSALLTAKSAEKVSTFMSSGGVAALGIAMLMVEGDMGEVISGEAKERAGSALQHIIFNAADKGASDPRRYIDVALGSVMISRSYSSYTSVAHSFDQLCQCLFRVSLRVNSLISSSSHLASSGSSSASSSSHIDGRGGENGGEKSGRGQSASCLHPAHTANVMSHHQMQLVMDQLRSSLTSLGIERPADFVKTIGREMGRGDLASAGHPSSSPSPSSPSSSTSASAMSTSASAAASGFPSPSSKKERRAISIQANVEASTVNLTALHTLMSVVKRHPFVVRPNLPDLVEAVLRMLDPNNQTMRERCLQQCTVALRDLVEKFACIDFHRGSQRLAVGTPAGAIVLYDMKIAARWRSFEGHHGQVVALKFTESGDSLLSICVRDGSLRGWKTHSMNIFKSLAMGSSRCFMNQALPGDVVKKLVDMEATLVPKKGQKTSIITRASLGVHLVVAPDNRSVSVHAGPKPVYEKAFK